MPSRILRDGILESKAVAALSEGAELFYRRLMSVVDDYGRYEADPEVLRARLFPRNLDRWSLTRVSESLTECGQVTVNCQPLVATYSVGGKEYLQINNFGQRERSLSKFPAPPEKPSRSDDGHVTVTCQTSAAHARAHSESESYSYSESNAESESESRVRGDALPAKQNGHKPDAELDLWAEAAYARHPKKSEKFLSLKALFDVFRDRPEERQIFDKHHEIMCQTPEWREKHGRFAPKLNDWILNDGWRSAPEEISAGEPEGIRYLRDLAKGVKS